MPIAVQNGLVAMNREMTDHDFLGPHDQSYAVNYTHGPVSAKSAVYAYFRAEIATLLDQTFNGPYRITEIPLGDDQCLLGLTIIDAADREAIANTLDRYFKHIDLSEDYNLAQHFDRATHGFAAQDQRLNEIFSAIQNQCAHMQVMKRENLAEIARLADPKLAR